MMNDHEIIKQINKQLDDQEHRDSDNLNQSLSNVRRQALDKADSNGYLNHQWMPFKALGAFSVTALVIVALSIYMQASHEHHEMLELSDFEILTTEDNLDFYEDLDFYQWLLLEEMHST